MTQSPLTTKYRFLGDSGLLVSRFGFGCMMFTNEDQVDEAYEILKHAYTHGVNFWDTAEGYAYGVSEVVTGKALQRGIDDGTWTREDIVLATKIYMGTRDGPNAKGLSRKHLIEGTKASLKRLGVDYVDVFFCHRIEPYTPIEEVVRTMNFIINQGWAFYWGTSEWSENDILEACAIADKLGLICPIVEQPEYNLFARSKVEVEFKALYEKHKLGLTTWSPLAYGLLTGKYADGIPQNARFSPTDPMVGFWLHMIGDLDLAIAKVEKLRPIAQQLDCSLAQLAIAWTASNEHVSSVLLGAKTLKQLDENLQAWAVVAKITPEIKQKIEEILPFTYKAPARDMFYSVRGAYL